MTGEDVPEITPGPHHPADREEKAKWPRYYEAVLEGGPAETLLAALQGFAAEPPILRLRFAVDLGCGVGRDTAELLRHGWSVLAIDSEPDAIKRLRNRPDLQHPERLQTRVARFEETSWRRADLVNASIALPFCPPDAFPSLWDRILRSIRRGGRFAGHLFGDRDDWATIPTRTHHTRQQVEELLESLDLEMFEELEYDGQTALGEQKHWHRFNIVARKR